MSEQVSNSKGKEGHYYRYEDGEYVELPRRRNTLPKVPVTEKANQAVINLQNAFVEKYNGYHFDPVLVCSGLILLGSEIDGIESKLEKFVIDFFQPEADSEKK